MRLLCTILDSISFVTPNCLYGIFLKFLLQGHSLDISWSKIKNILYSISIFLRQLFEVVICILKHMYLTHCSETITFTLKH